MDKWSIETERMRMLKLDIRHTYFLMFAAVAVIYDVFVNAGWALSLFYLIASFYWLVKLRYNPNDRYGFKAVVGCSVFLITTLSGYAVAKYIETDFIQFAASPGSEHPKDKFELVALGKQRLAFVTRISFIGYANIEGRASAKLRAFPYKVGYYDFNSKQFRWHAYD